MREIKFRALSNLDNTWRYFSLSLLILSNIKNQALEEIIPDTLTQYTGLKDKNGKEIYEGDIVTIRAYNEVYTSDVKFKDGMFGIQWKNYTTTSAMLKVCGWFDNIEVIGNIYENPDLVESKECGKEK